MDMTLLNDLKDYSRKDFSRDFIAGLTVVIILIPQTMAYAMLAGLDPIYGLYAALVPLFIYPVLASSRHLSVGPVALMSIIVLAGISPLAEPGSDLYLNLVLLASLLSGIFQVLFAVFRLGNLATFLSKPVMSGFISAAGIIIVVSQLKYILGLSLPRQTSAFNLFVDAVKHIGETNFLSLAIGVVSILFIVLVKRIKRTFPTAIILVVLGSLLFYKFNWASLDVDSVGYMPAGLPKFDAQFILWDKMLNLIPISLVIAAVCFVGSYSIAKSVAEKDGDYPIDANKELVGLGMSKVLGSFFLSMPSTGSFTRSAINFDAGAKTGLASIFTGAFLVLILLFFSHWFYYLPEPILAAIVITSVFSLIDLEHATHLFKTDRKDFIVLLITFLSTLIMGIVSGIAIGIIASILSYVRRTSKSNYAVLGRLPNKTDFRNIERFSKAKPISEILIIRFSQTFYFGNAHKVLEAIKSELVRFPNTKYIVISYPDHGIPDSTATSKLFSVVSYCHERGIRLIFTDLFGPVRDYFFRTKLNEEVGKQNFFLSIKDAVNAIENGHLGLVSSNVYSAQSSYVDFDIDDILEEE